MTLLLLYVDSSWTIILAPETPIYVLHINISNKRPHWRGGGTAFRVGGGIKKKGVLKTGFTVFFKTTIS